MKNTYKPLPDSLTIKQSGINGLGLFAKEGIGQGTNLGISHIKIKRAIVDEEGKIFRTPLGGFINHSNEANCVKVEFTDDIYEEKWNLIALRNIKEGEELTVRYTFYNV